MFPNWQRCAASAFDRLVFEGKVVDQSAWLASLGHDVITGVDTKATGDTFHLLAVTDVDPHRTDIHAGHAVNAIAHRFA